jgi:hypothetical protein
VEFVPRACSRPTQVKTFRQSRHSTATGFGELILASSGFRFRDHGNLKQAIGEVLSALEFVDSANDLQAATTLIRAALRERGFCRITISTSWSSAVNRFIRRSTEKPTSL